MMKRPLATLTLFAACILPLHAQTKLPPGESLLRTPGLQSFALQLMPSAFDAVSIKTVDTDGSLGFTEAWRIETSRDTGPSFAVQLRASAAKPLKEGDIGIVRFFARTISSNDESGLGQVGLAVRKAVGWGMGIANEDFNPATEWTEFHVPFRSDADYRPFETLVSFSFGYRKQVVEIGGVECINFGTSVAFNDLPRTRFTYAGREPDAAWRQAALARIEKIRKGDISVRVVNASGKPVPNASVALEQTRSAFEWGTAIPFQRLVNDSPDNRIFREKVLELFNAASPENDLKWGAWAGESSFGNYSREQAIAGLKWLRERDFHARGHVLVWPGWNNLPDSVRDLRDTPRQSEIPQLVLDHIRDIGAATRDYLEEFDVLNEPFTNHDLMDLFGPSIMVDWFKTAREVMPNVTLYLNDFSNHDFTTDGKHVEHFSGIARYLLEHDAPLDALGLQAHIGGKPNAPENVLATLDRYWSEFQLPMRITEFDIRTSDEELQADYTRDFFILAFSHPSIIGLQVWGFWERAHWIPVAAMYRGDWSEKPNAAVYKDLVLNQWRTQFTDTTGKDGSLATRGFYGDYKATVTVNGQVYEKAFTLRKDQPANVEIKLSK